MVDAREESSEDSSDSTSSDNFSIYTETSSSEEDLQNVEEPRTSTSSATTHNSRKGKSKSFSKQPTVKSQRATNSLNDDQMKELTSWIFSTQEANEVEVHIRSCLLEPPRVTSTKERSRFAKHLLCEEQKANFQLWPVRTSVNISDFEGKKFKLRLNVPQKRATCFATNKKNVGTICVNVLTSDRLKHAEVTALALPAAKRKFVLER